MKKCISVLFVLAMFCSIVSYDSFAEAIAENDKFTLEVKDKLINLQAKNADFKEILQELEAKTGIKVNIYEGVKDNKVSLNVKSLPVHAVWTILEKMSLKNFAVVYDDQLASVAIYILPEGKDISKVTKGKSIIRHANFASGKTIDTIKDRKIVSITKGKNKIPIRYVKDEVLLKFHLGVSKQEIQEILKKYKLVEVSDGTLSKIGYIKVRIPDGRDVISVIKEIRKEYKLKIPEPNYISNILTVSDPLFNDQWYIPDINFDKAWEKAKSKDPIKVAVIDSGIDAGHPDLKGKILNGCDFVNDDTDASDDHGHGTFVAGIIAATANNIGIKGLYDHAQIIPIKVIDENGLGTYEDVAEGILYAADNGAKVINLSIGGYGYSFMLQEAVDYALEKGCIVVAAGGNDGIEQQIYPAGYPDVIAVSALGYNGEIWPDSNSGRHIDVSAPGVNIISTGLGESYVYASGTSASASMVSALVAMLVSEKPDLSSSFIERLIIQSAKDLGENGWDKIYGGGEIDAHAALKQEVEPYHDVAVRSVHIEPVAFEKEKPTYIVANIENTGTYESEECDVILYEIIGEEKKEIGTKEAVAVIDKTKVIFEWKPERLKENIKFEVSVFSEEDENSSNNSKTTCSFFIEESDGLYILYKNRPYVHSWVALQAYNILPSGELKNEMTDSILYGGATYDQLFGSSRVWEDQYAVPNSWSTDRKSGSSLFEGTWEEDEDYYYYGIWWPAYLRHFWDPDQGYDYGLDTILIDRNHSALYQAEYWWDEAISAYATNSSLAYYYLGRVVHLLGDMGVPEHVHNDQHPATPVVDKDDYSNYEEYTKIYYRNYTASGSPKNIDTLPLSLPSSYVPLGYDTRLAKLFYNMAQYTQHFDSSDYNGNNQGYGGGYINMGISPDSGNKNQAYKAIAYLTEGNDRIDPGTTPTIIWQKYKVIGGYYDYETLYEGPYVDSTNYVDISRGYGQVSYSNGLWDEQNNTLDRLKITYRYRNQTKTDYITNPKDNPYYYSVPDHYIDDQVYSIFRENIRYTAALYQLFWERTDDDRDDDGDGYTENQGDCDDNDVNEHPNQTWYKDTDGDEYSDGTTNTTSCTRPSGYKVTSELTATSGDCDDYDASIHPGATEICDGEDNDCDGQIDEGVGYTYYRDADGDGYGDPNVIAIACTQPSDYVTNNSDCDDNDVNEHPNQTWYKDTDGDGYSDGTTNTTSCTRPTGYKVSSELSAISGDCNDNDASINPGATEICGDGIDQDCNGTDLSCSGVDNDGDGYTESQGDCNDSDNTIYPGATELCDGVDNNCDGEIDEECKSADQFASVGLPDTGQTESYTDTFGEDSDYNINPPSYTKLDDSGNDLPDDASSWVMVRDNVTGLIWEVKTDDGSIHDKDDCYHWQDVVAVFVADLNANNFGGYSDWRWPTIKELSSIINSGTCNPAVNTDYFPNTVSLTYWSSNTNVNNTDYAWYAHYYHGTVTSEDKSFGSYGFRVRAVRGRQTGPLDHLVMNGDGTVTDTLTGLMWQQVTAGARNWESAISYCEGLSLAGYDDWRLPNRNDLQSLVDYSICNPAIDTTTFPDTLSLQYWSSTTPACRDSAAWYVNFDSGRGSNIYKSDSYYVRAVRGGQNRFLGHLVISVPGQASSWDVGSLMPITWDNQGITGDVKISISREGGKEGTFETIAESTENNGSYEWAVIGPGSINCMLEIEPLGEPSKGTTQGLFAVHSLPQVKEVIPHHNAGIDDSTRIPSDTSFAVRIEDSDGIDITDTSSINFTIDDGVNEAYTRDLGDDTVVRIVKLTEDEDTEVTKLWAVYDRSMEATYGDYSYDADINIKVDAKDRRGDWMTQRSYDFKPSESDDPILPDTGPVDLDDPALEGSYDTGTQMNSGDLEGAKIVFDSNEPVTPRFGPTNELPEFDIVDVDAVGASMNLQPPTVFTTPVKIFIPCPGQPDVSALGVYLYNGTDWVPACDANGNVQLGGEGWMVPGSRLYHPDSYPPTIEIKVYHFTGVQAGIFASTDDDSDTPAATSDDGDDGCFIATAAYGSSMADHVVALKEFRDNILLKNSVGRSFVRFYYKVSPPLADYIKEHESLKTAVRISLLPLVAISYSALHFGPIITLTGFVALLAIPILLVSFYRRKARG